MVGVGGKQVNGLNKHVYVPMYVHVYLCVVVLSVDVRCSVYCHNVCVCNYPPTVHNVCVMLVALTLPLCLVIAL